MFHRSVAISAATAAAAVSAELLTISLTKISDEEHLANLLISHAPPRLVRTSSLSAVPRRLLRGDEKGEENVVLRDLSNAQYYGTVNIGTPSQELQAVFDTGSSDFWVPGVACLTSSENCSAKKAFDKSASSSYSAVPEGAKSEFTIRYGSGPVRGKFAVETVTLADDFTATGQTFAIVNDTDGLGQVYGKGKFDGILGLGFPSLSKNPDVNTLIPNLKEQGVLPKAMFAFYLGDNADGELAVGGYDKEKIQGEINWVDLIRPAYWLVGMDQVKFGDAIVSTGQRGIMDTGTSLLYGPAKQVNSMAVSVGGRLVSQVNLYLIDCGTEIPDLEFTVGGQAYVVPGSRLVLRDGSSQYCFLSVAVMNIYVGSDGADTTWLVGDSFLREIYSIYDFDNQKFGIAQLKQ